MWNWGFIWRGEERRAWESLETEGKPNMAEQYHYSDERRRRFPKCHLSEAIQLIQWRYWFISALTLSCCQLHAITLKKNVALCNGSGGGGVWRTSDTFPRRRVGGGSSDNDSVFSEPTSYRGWSMWLVSLHQGITSCHNEFAFVCDNKENHTLFLKKSCQDGAEFLGWSLWYIFVILW